jgi:hypothetical protein
MGRTQRIIAGASRSFHDSIIPLISKLGPRVPLLRGANHDFTTILPPLKKEMTTFGDLLVAQMGPAPYLHSFLAPWGTLTRTI